MSSKSFQKLLELSWAIGMSHPETNCERVALYLCMKPKEQAVELVPGLEDSEWGLIQDYMRQHAHEKFGRPLSEMVKRIDWIRSLDMLREFERE